MQYTLATTNVLSVSGSTTLLKTFYTGPGGWTDQQLSDGAVL